MRSRAAVAGATLAAFLATVPAAPAQAQVATYNDPVGDTAGPGLDITGVTVRNRDRSVLATVSFAQDRRGDLIFGVVTRSGHGIAVVNEHRPLRGDRTFDPDPEPGERCRRLRVTWDRAQDTATIRIPSRCIADGDYGAVRFFVLTEDSPSRHGDIDLAPNRVGREQTPWSRWIPRG